MAMIWVPRYRPSHQFRSGDRRRRFSFSDRSGRGGMPRLSTVRLLELINSGPFELINRGGRDEDRYGRKLRTIERDGRSLGEMLVAEGLARRWDGARGSWCG